MFSDEEINNADPIDLVYLWCDGQDPAFKNERLTRLKDLNLPWNEDNLGSLRYFDNEELRYSLRSVWKNLPWVNHIYIITNNQKPTWLAQHPKVTVVDHSEIMPNFLLPCFNSVTIEMYVHKIPGLAEKYLLANDDMFFASPLEPSFFFKDNLPGISHKMGRRFLRRGTCTFSSSGTAIYGVSLIHNQLGLDALVDCFKN